MKFSQYFFLNELHTRRQFSGKRSVVFELNLGLVDTYMFWYYFNKPRLNNTPKYLYNSPQSKILASSYITSGDYKLHMVYFVECY